MPGRGGSLENWPRAAQTPFPSKPAPPVAGHGWWRSCVPLTSGIRYTKLGGEHFSPPQGRATVLLIACPHGSRGSPRGSKKMNIHEYQAKQLLARYDVLLARGGVAFTPEEAEKVATDIGGTGWAVKAQILAGDRGRAGGVKLVRSTADVRETAAAIRRKPASDSDSCSAASLDRTPDSCGCI